MNTLRFTLNAASNYCRMAIAIGATIVLTPRMIGALGAGDFGLWALIQSTLGMAMLLDLGFGNAVLRASAESTNAERIGHRNRLVSTLWTASLAVAGVAAAGALAVGIAFPRLFDIPAGQATKAVTVFLLIAARQLLVALPFGLFRGVLFGDGRIFEINIVQSLTTVAQTLAVWLALAGGYGLTTVAVLTLCGGIVEHAGYVWLARKRVGGLTVSPRLADMATLNEARSFCTSSFLIGVSGVVLLKTDPILAKFFLPLSAVALYAVALKIAENILLLIKQIANALTPVIVRLNGEGADDRLRQMLLTFTKFLLVPAVMALVGTISHGRTALTIWIGHDFAAAWPVLVMLMVATTITITELPAGSLLVLGGQHAVGARAAVASSVINVVATLILIKPLGLLGVAAGTVGAGCCVDLGLIVRTALARYGISVGAFARRVYLPVAVAGVAQWIVARLVAGAVGEPHTLAALAAVAAPGAMAFLLVFAGVGVTQDERRHLAAHLVRPLWARVSSAASFQSRAAAEAR